MYSGPYGQFDTSGILSDRNGILDTIQHLNSVPEKRMNRKERRKNQAFLRRS